MKNNKVFVLCDTTKKRWQMPCANAERHIESVQFSIDVEHDDRMLFSAVSPRRVWNGFEKDDKEKFVKLKKAFRECRYVYMVDGWENDPVCVKLKKRAWLKIFIVEEED